MATDRLRFLALGDSYTCGEGVQPPEGWCWQLAALLRSDGIRMEDPEVVARTGWTTDELIDGLAAAPPDGTFQLVSLLIGVNDQYRGRDLEGYAARFTELLEYAIRRAAGDARRVLVLSIPDWGVTPFASGHDRARVAREIDRFNAVNRSLAREHGAQYTDVTTISRQAGGALDMLVADQLHPSGRMYARWARLALPAAHRALASLPPEPARPGPRRSFPAA